MSSVVCDVGPERTNTAGRNSALATQHPILVYIHLNKTVSWYRSYMVRVLPRAVDCENGTKIGIVNIGNSGRGCKQWRIDQPKCKQSTSIYETQM
ncbi:hypothetical protein OUZ56_001417 [Daphnia magna]|uniref:Uncharacterized protein n=1 Tax=Daphnia magna TaxID=35525 RepID=A0ABR0A343_9CRUS|nr:hypothetical protein OUZ56_001417 [Daphnia magna]